MKPKIIAVLGLGVFGSTICRTLSQFDVEIIAVDKEIENVNRVDQYVTQGVEADITNIESLRNIGLEEADIAIVATGSSLESTVLAVVHLKELGVPKVICKARNKTYLKVLEKLGADLVVRPEKQMGERIAKELMRNVIIDTIVLDDQYSVVEFKVPKNWVNHTIQSLNVRQNYDINLIGLRASAQEKMVINFDINEPLKPTDILVGIAESERFEQLDFLNQL